MELNTKVPCPACGEQNVASATFCWKCHATMTPAGPPAMPAAPPISPGLGQDWGAPPVPAPVAPPRRRWGHVALGAVIGVAVATGVGSFFGSSVNLPDSISDTPRLTSADAKDFESQMADEAEKWDLDAKAAAYGTIQPEFLVIAVERSAEETTDELFSEFVGGMSASGAVVDEGAAVTRESGDTEYRCLPVSGPGLEASACLWRDDDNVGIVLDLTAEGDGVAFAAVVHDAVTD